MIASSNAEANPSPELAFKRPNSHPYLLLKNIGRIIEFKGEFNLKGIPSKKALYKIV